MYQYGGILKRPKSSVLKTERSVMSRRVGSNPTSSAKYIIGRCGMNTDAVAGRSGGARTRRNDDESIQSK